MRGLLAMGSVHLSVSLQAPCLALNVLNALANSDRLTVRDYRQTATLTLIRRSGTRGIRRGPRRRVYLRLRLLHCHCRHSVLAVPLLQRDGPRSSPFDLACPEPNLAQRHPFDLIGDTEGRNSSKGENHHHIGLPRAEVEGEDLPSQPHRDPIGGHCSGLVPASPAPGREKGFHYPHEGS